MPWNSKAACVYSVPFNIEAGAVEADVPYTIRRHHLNNTSECKSDQYLAKRNDQVQYLFTLIANRPEPSKFDIDNGASIRTHIRIDIRRCVRLLFIGRFSVRSSASIRHQPLLLSFVIRFLLFSTYSVGLDTSAGR
jgi:hypothetical protein